MLDIFKIRCYFINIYKMFIFKLRKEKSMTKLSPSRRAKRNERIVRLYKSQKHSIRSIASIIGLSKSQVGRIVLENR